MFFLSNGYSPANLANSSTRAKLAVFGECEYSPKRPFSEMCRTRQTRQHSPSRVARTRQTRESQVWRVLRKFGKFGEFGECRLDRFKHIQYVICTKNNLSYHACLCQHSPRGLASTRQTRQHSPSHVARTRQTCQHSPSHVARTRQTRPHSPKVISGKM